MKKLFLLLTVFVVISCQKKEEESTEEVEPPLAEVVGEKRDEEPEPVQPEEVSEAPDQKELEVLRRKVDEYEEAKQNIKGNIQLPIGNVKFEYKKSNRKSYISGEDYNIELTEASSGYQSMVPLILVTKYLSDLISNKIHENIKNNLQTVEICYNNNYMHILFECVYL